jgi:hypothetical protein
LHTGKPEVLRGLGVLLWMLALAQLFFIADAVPLLCIISVPAVAYLGAWLISQSFKLENEQTERMIENKEDK